MSEDAIKDAYRRGAKDFASELQRRATNWPPRRHSAAGRIDPEIAARYVLVSYDLWREIERGEWPKGGDDAN